MVRSFTGLLILYFNFIIITILSDDADEDICIWNRRNDATTYVNGLYVNKGHYYVKEDSGCGTNSSLYLYEQYGQWRINNVYPTDTEDYIALCDSDIIHDLPSDCGNNWRVKIVYYNNYVIT